MRARNLVVGFGAMVLSGVAAGATGAQPVLVRGDVLASLSGGSAFGAANCYFCTERGLPAVRYAVSYALQTRVTLGIEGTWAFARLEGPCSRACSFTRPRTPEEVYFRTASHSLTVQVYPHPDVPYFLKLGVGAATDRVAYTTERNGDSPPVRTVRDRRALNPKLGLGVERQLGSRATLSVHLDASYAAGGGIDAGGASLNEHLVYAGVALTWRVATMRPGKK